MGSNGSTVVSVTDSSGKEAGTASSVTACEQDVMARHIANIATDGVNKVFFIVLSPNCNTNYYSSIITKKQELLPALVLFADDLINYSPYPYTLLNRSHLSDPDTYRSTD